MVRVLSTARLPVGASLGSCIDMAASTSRVTFTVPAALDPANLTAFGVGFWLSPRPIDGTARRIFEPNGGAGAGFQVFISAVAGVAVRVQHSVTNAEQDTGPATLPRGEWSHLVMNWNDSYTVPKIYINGVQYNTAAFQTAKSGVRNVWSGSTCYIGNTAGLSAAYNGMLDQICLLSREWTDAEISAARYGLVLPTTNRILLYQMEELVGAGTVADSAGTATGTATGCTQGVAGYAIPARVAVA